MGLIQQKKGVVASPLDCKTCKMDGLVVGSYWVRIGFAPGSCWVRTGLVLGSYWVCTGPVREIQESTQQVSPMVIFGTNFVALEFLHGISDLNSF